MSNTMFSSNLVITGGSFTQHNDHRPRSKDSFERLQEAASPAAFHNAGARGDPPKCHPNTRVAVLEKIMRWILGLDPATRDALIMWLQGPAGSGKSAIAQTIAERCFDEHILLASYFFSRFDSTRNHARSLIPTIAYQVASHFPTVRDLVIAAIDDDPLIFTRSLAAQILSLIVKPLRNLIASGYFNDPKSMRLIIIDGLDECENRSGQLDILRTISNVLQQYHLPLIFLIASRPEHDITYAFRAGYLREISTCLPLDNEYKPSSDIALFLRDEFADIKETHPFKAQIPCEWPTEDVLQYLVHKSSGQFIYAATVIKFVQSTRHQPTDRLAIASGLRPAVYSSDMPFAELDALYHHIFSSVENLETILQILALHLLSKWEHRLFFVDIAEIVSLSPHESTMLFCDLYSVVRIADEDISGRRHIKGPDPNLTILHASLEDFLLDKSRSKNLYIDAPLRHAQFAHIIFQKKLWRSKDGNQYFHIERAPPDAELRQQILNLDIPQLLTQEWGTADIPQLLYSIKKSQFHDAEELYSRHVQSFDQYVIERVKIYYSDPRLIALVAFVAKGIRIWGSRATSYSCLFRIDDGLRLIDSSNLRLLDLIERDSEQFWDFIQNFLVDSTRSGRYAVNGHKYANASLYFLQYTCHLSPQKIPARFTGPRKMLLWKNNPFKWLRKIIWKNKESRRRKTIHDGDESHSPIHDNDESDTPFPDTRSAFYVALQSIPPILDAAAQSKELVEFARQHAFQPISQKFPQETKAAKGAIRRYLKRMDSRDA